MAGFLSNHWGIHLGSVMQASRLTMIPRVVCVEGLIAAGKSTLLKTLPSSEFRVILEPVEKFQNFAGHNPLQKFYQDMGKQAFTQQTYINQVLKNHWREHLTACKPEQIIVSERSLYATNIFSLNLRDMGYLDAFQYDFLKTQIQESIDSLGVPEYGADKLFILDVAPEECQRRMTVRDRLEEKSHCDLAYLSGLYLKLGEYAEAFARVKGPTKVKVTRTGDLASLTDELVRFVLS